MWSFSFNVSGMEGDACRDNSTVADATTAAMGALGLTSLFCWGISGGATPAGHPSDGYNHLVLTLHRSRVRKNARQTHDG
jgi:hypothetical protein